MTRLVCILLLIISSLPVDAQDCKAYFSKYNLGAQDIESKKIALIKRSDYAIYLTFYNSAGRPALKTYFTDSYSMISGDKITFYSATKGVKTFTLAEDNGLNEAVATTSLDNIKWLATVKIERMVINRVGRDMRKFTIAFDKSSVINRYATCFYNAMSSVKLVELDKKTTTEPGTTTTPTNPDNPKQELIKEVAEARAKAAELKKKYAEEVRQSKIKSDEVKKNIAADLAEYKLKADTRQKEMEAELARVTKELEEKEALMARMEADLKVKQAHYDRTTTKLDSLLAIKRAGTQEELAEIEKKKKDLLGTTQKEIEEDRVKLAEIKKELLKDAALERKRYEDSVIAYRLKKDQEIKVLEEKATLAKRRIMEEVTKSMQASLDQLAATKKMSAEEVAAAREEVLKIKKNLANEVYTARKDTAEKIADIKETAHDEIVKIQKELHQQKTDIIQEEKAEVKKTEVDNKEIEEARKKAEETKKALYEEVTRVREETEKIKHDLALEINKARKDTAVKIQELKKEAAEEILNYRNQVIEEKKKLGEELREEQERTAGLVTTLKEEATAEIEKSREEALKIKKELAEEVLQAKKDTAQKIAELRKQAAEEIKVQKQALIEEKKSQAQEMAKVKKAYADTLALINSKYGPEINKAIGESKDSLETLQALIAKANAELAQIRKETKQFQTTTTVVQLPKLSYSAQWTYEREDLIEKKRALEMEPLEISENKLVYKTEYLGYPATEDYMFIENRLNEVNISIATEKGKALDEYYDVVTKLRAQFGEPILREERWNKKKYKDNKDQWLKAIEEGHLEIVCEYELGNTHVQHILHSKDGKLLHQVISRNTGD